MQLLRQWCLTSQLALLLLLLLRLNALCAADATRSSHDIHIATSPKSIDRRERSRPLSAQPLSIRPATTNNNNNSNRAIRNTTTTPLSAPYTFRLLDFRAIATSPDADANLFAALDRFCEASANALLDFDLLEAHYLSLRFGDLTLEFRDVGQYVSMLAVKAVLRKLMILNVKGLRGFLKGEVLDVQAEVRMVFSFGVRGVA